MLREKIRKLAHARPRWGYHRRLHVLLLREGWKVNHKRVQRLYRKEELAVRRKGKRRRSQAPRPVGEVLGAPNERWSLDFVSDTLSNGRTFSCLTVVDEFSREALAVHVAHSSGGGRHRSAKAAPGGAGLPAVIITDNGSEFTSRAFDAWRTLGR